MSEELIAVTGARENDLRDLSVRIPERRITAFIGVVGSDKSSRVFHTASSCAAVPVAGR
jgi:excinuclease UvrABC ATPase subunit